jgi:hypothetical protein
MSDAFTRLALKVESYNIGYQHGRRLAPAIADNVEVYFTLFKHCAGLDGQAVFGRSDDFVRLIGAFDEDLMTEIRGIAEGSGNRSKRLWRSTRTPRSCSGKARIFSTASARSYRRMSRL